MLNITMSVVESIAVTTTPTCHTHEVLYFMLLLLIVKRYSDTCCFYVCQPSKIQYADEYRVRNALHSHTRVC